MLKVLITHKAIELMQKVMLSVHRIWCIRFDWSWDKFDRWIETKSANEAITPEQNMYNYFQECIFNHDCIEVEYKMIDWNCVDAAEDSDWTDKLETNIRSVASVHFIIRLLGAKWRLRISRNGQQSRKERIAFCHIDSDCVTLNKAFVARGRKFPKRFW